MVAVPAAGVRRVRRAARAAACGRGARVAQQPPPCPARCDTVWRATTGTSNAGTTIRRFDSVRTSWKSVGGCRDAMNCA